MLMEKLAGETRPEAIRDIQRKLAVTKAILEHRRIGKLLGFFLAGGCHGCPLSDYYSDGSRSAQRNSMLQSILNDWQYLAVYWSNLGSSPLSLLQYALRVSMFNAVLVQRSSTASPVIGSMGSSFRLAQVPGGWRWTIRTCSVCQSRGPSVCLRRSRAVRSALRFNPSGRFRLCMQAMHMKLSSGVRWYQDLTQHRDSVANCRRGFVASAGNVLLGADYCQVGGRLGDAVTPAQG